MTVANTHGINALPFRCYNKVYNEWFRPEYIIDPVDENIGDGPDDYADYVLLRRAKRLDYFTGALPWPQRGPAVDMPLLGSAPVYGDGKALGLTDGTYNIGLSAQRYTGGNQGLASGFKSDSSTSAPGLGIKFGYGTNVGTALGSNYANNPNGTFTTVGVVTSGSSGLYADLYGLPVGITNTHGINALPFRCYNKVYNEWFRPEYIIDPVDENIGDGPDDYADYVLLRRAKRLDYFTGALPWPQRGPAVDLPLVGNAPVSGTMSFTPTLPNTFKSFSANSTPGQLRMNSQALTVSQDENVTKYGMYMTGTTTGLFADLSNVSSFTINTMRQAFQLQKFYERLARGGSRYTEIIRSCFGVS